MIGTLLALACTQLATGAPALQDDAPRLTNVARSARLSTSQPTGAADVAMRLNVGAIIGGILVGVPLSAAGGYMAIGGMLAYAPMSALWWVGAASLVALGPALGVLLANITENEYRPMVGAVVGGVAGAVLAAALLFINPPIGILSVILLPTVLTVLGYILDVSHLEHEHLLGRGTDEDAPAIVSLRF